MVRHQLRAGLHRVDEIAFEQFGDLPMILLTCAPKQRLISRVLDQRVLEHVARPRRAASLIEQLGLGILALPKVEIRQIVERVGSLRMLRSYVLLPDM